MKLKTIELNGTTYAEVQDGKPVYEADDGKVIAFDAVHSSATIKRLNDENKQQREARAAAEKQLQNFADLDPEAARKAIETVSNLDAKKLIDAGEVEKVKREAKEAFDRQFEAQYKPIEAERNALRSRLHNKELGLAFSQSEFVTKKMAYPVDFIQARFGNHFSVDDDGKILAKGPDGNPLYSRARPGEEAGFDEAIEILVEAHPRRDELLRGSGASGGGANGSRSVNGKRTITRAQHESMAPEERMAVAIDKNVAIVD